MSRARKIFLFAGLGLLLIIMIFLLARIFGPVNYRARVKKPMPSQAIYYVDGIKVKRPLPPAGPPKSLETIYHADLLISEGKYENSICELKNLQDENIEAREKFWINLLLSENGRLKAKYQQGVPGSEANKNFSEGTQELSRAAELVARAKFSNGEKQKAYIRLGSAYMGRCLFKEAEHYFQEASLVRGHDYYKAYALTHAGHCMINRGARSDASRLARDLEKMLEKGTLYPDIICLLGEIYYGIPDYKRARYWFNKTIEISPYSSIGLEARIYLAWMDLQTGKRKSASLELQQVLEGLVMVYGSPDNIPPSTGSTLFGMMLFTFSDMEAFKSTLPENERKFLRTHADKANDLFKQGHTEEMMKEIKIILKKMRSGGF
ncbi:MAG: hypothetical protein J7M18_05795 [Candidatus Eremiobacteraeota bacterium]|nr:hypothetical protein [Candidatus Eremiobacteraeota bacterium]